MNPDTSRGPDEIQRIIWLIDEGGAHPKLTEAIERLKALRAALASERDKGEGELCPECQGNGWTMEPRSVEPDGHPEPFQVQCERCHGTGRLSPAPDATALRAAARPIAEAWERGEFFITELDARKAVALLGVTTDQLGDLARALLATPPRDAPGKGDGSLEHPFRDQFSGKCFERKDHNGMPFSFGVCERDDGYELTVLPVRPGSELHYRLAPDGTIADLAPGEPEVGR